VAAVGSLQDNVDEQLTDGLKLLTIQIGELHSELEGEKQ
jgi:hypothetical protein